jgi:hypothetical protein
LSRATFTGCVSVRNETTFAGETEKIPFPRRPGRFTKPRIVGAQDKTREPDLPSLC